MKIGEKIKRMRLRLGLTQEELADRTELTKGFISQLERDITSPSIATLEDILAALGSNACDFFRETADEKTVYTAEEMFIKEDPELGSTVCWLVPNAQKNIMEPILVTLLPGGKTYEDDPHEGEEFGYVLSGAVVLHSGENRFKLKKGDSFYFHPSGKHYLENTSRTEAKLIWLSTPPSF